MIDRAGRQPPHLPARPGRGRRAARLPRPVLEPEPWRRSRRPSSKRRGGHMSHQAAETSARTSVVVEAPLERAFRVFTEELRELVAARATTSSRASWPRRCSSRTWAARSTTAASTAASAGGRRSSPTSRRTASCSAGTSTRSGQLENDPERSERGRGALHRRGAGAHARRARAPPPRPPRRGLGGHAGRGRRRPTGGLGAHGAVRGRGV